MSSTTPDERSRKRVRTGCLTCRGRHRKCDETKPVCLNCRLKTLPCKWTVHGQFSESNSRYLSPAGHNSVVPNLFDNEIVIVDEVRNISKHHPQNRREASRSDTKRLADVESLSFSNKTPAHSRITTPVESSMLSRANSIPRTGNNGMSPETSFSTLANEPVTLSTTRIQARAPTPSARRYSSSLNSSSKSPDVETTDLRTVISATSAASSPASQTWSHDADAIIPSQSGAALADISPLINMSLPAGTGPLFDNEKAVPRRAAISISQIIGSEVVSAHGNIATVNNLEIPNMVATMLGQSSNSVAIPAAGEHQLAETEFSLESSAYRDLHDTLRDYMFSSAKSAKPSRVSSPLMEATEVITRSPTQDECTLNGCTLSNTDKTMLLRNYIDEIASWLDMFDSKRYFAVRLPRLSLKSQALFFSLLAISSRQMERIKPQYPSDMTLELYQLSIQYLLPTVQSNSIETIAACVILCCLEMMSSSPHNWRRHLEGCAALFASAGINGFCGGLGQSLFWCFARMDLSCAVIGEESTIIKIPDWLSQGQSFDDAQELFRTQTSYHMYANYAVFLCSRVTNLIASDCQLAGDSYDFEWEKLWNELRIWFEERPVEMKPLLSFDQHINEPFPTVLYGNGPAISGNQMCHMACILLMQNKPRSFKIPKANPSMLWHAKQICAISLSNTHHGCWNNALQPLWIAGRLMSHHTEHIAILRLLDEIEKSTGWAMKWRGDDLKELWGMR
ncbi:hypothetical protein V1517DRAFT_262531 [Lipomyces orientalis]|uniref:Uncharacterized protein n=1 Tax=Lipomyces orientalis TaxID=1233043 RepID=A0ACC3TL46_9ASCO